MARDDFIANVRTEGAAAYRDLPWRHTDDPYAILVSEVMLQQTQVSRVATRWERWMRLFPNVDSVAAASSADILEEWQGLGYNRRALALKRACDICSQQYGGALPTDEASLLALPGIGPSTAAGVRVFALNVPAAYVETNVRTVFMTDVFPNEPRVPDSLIAALLADVCPPDDARGWYTNLLDYGAKLKADLKSGRDTHARQAPIPRQSTFEGSRRQKRAEAVRTVLASPGIARDELVGHLRDYEESHGRKDPGEQLLNSIIDDLVAEGFFHETDGRLVP